MPDEIIVKIHNGLNGILPDIRPAWDECLKQCPDNQQLFTYEWCAAWMATYGSRSPWTGESLVLTAEDRNGGVAAILPFAVRKEKGLTFLSLAGLYQPFRSFACVPSLAEPATKALVGTVLTACGKWDVLRLGPFDTDAPERSHLFRTLNSSAPNTIVIPHGPTVVNRLHTTLADYTRMGSFQRIRRYEKKWRREGTAEVRHFHNPTDRDTASCLQDCRTIEQKCWLVEKGGDLRFATDTDFTFWNRIIADCPNSRVEFDTWIAYFNHEPAAFRVTLRAGSCSYILANQFDSRFAEYRLGWILYIQNIEYACANGIAGMEFAPNALHYNDRLGAGLGAERFDLLVFRPSLKGAILALAVKSYLGARNFLGKHRVTRAISSRLP